MPCIHNVDPACDDCAAFLKDLTGVVLKATRAPEGTPAQKMVWHYRRFVEEGETPKAAERKAAMAVGKPREEAKDALMAKGIDVDEISRKAWAKKGADRFRANVAKGMKPGVAVNKLAAGRKSAEEVKELLAEVGAQVVPAKKGPEPVAPLRLAWKDGPGCVMLSPQETLDEMRRLRSLQERDDS